MKRLKGRVKQPEGFEDFPPGLVSLPGERLEGVKFLYVGDVSGRTHISLKDSVAGMVCDASGSMELELRGDNRLRRIITVPEGSRLKLSYVSRGGGTVEDLVYLKEGAELVYDGRFRVRSGAFTASVRVVHEGKKSSSKVDLRGVVRGKARILPTGELLPGSVGSRTSLNGFVVVFGRGEVKAVPELLVGEQEAAASHSFKKLRLTQGQQFYLSSRGLGENNIERLYERFILGG